MKRECVQFGIGRTSYWGCDSCRWRFKPSGQPIGNSLEEMATLYYANRDRDFALHKCEDHSEK